MRLGFPNEREVLVHGENVLTWATESTELTGGLRG